MGGSQITIYLITVAILGQFFIASCTGTNVVEKKATVLRMGMSASDLRGKTISPIDSTSSQLLMLKTPQLVKFRIGDQTFTFESGGSNSAILLTTSKRLDGPVVTAISADSGSELLPLEEAKMVANNWCQKLLSHYGSAIIVNDFMETDQVLDGPIVCCATNRQNDGSTAEVTLVPSNFSNGIIGHRLNFYYSELR